MMNMEWIHTLQWSRVLFILFLLLLAPNNIEDWQNYWQTLKIIGLNIRDGSKVLDFSTEKCFENFIKYQSNLLIKLLVFEFINNFLVMYFLAFIYQGKSCILLEAFQVWSLNSTQTRYPNASEYCDNNNDCISGICGDFRRFCSIPDVPKTNKESIEKIWNFIRSNEIWKIKRWIRRKMFDLEWPLQTFLDPRG